MLETSWWNLIFNFMFHANLTITDNVFILCVIVAAGLVGSVLLAVWLINKLLD